jgi:hypothetical protein
MLKYCPFYNKIKYNLSDVINARVISRCLWPHIQSHLLMLLSCWLGVHCVLVGYNIKKIVPSVLPTNLPQAIRLSTCIQEGPGLNLIRDTIKSWHCFFMVFRRSSR